MPVSSVTPSSMIISALVKNGEKFIGDTLNTNEQTAYLSMLQAMIDSWGLQRGWCNQILEENFPLTVSTSAYTIGPNGVFQTNRPTKIENAFVRGTDNYDHPIRIVPQEQFNTIANKIATNAFPTYMYYDNGYDATSSATMNFWPVPLNAYTLYIHSWKQLPQFASISTQLVMPPGYQRAIEFNFAIEASPGLKSVPPEVIMVAKESKAAVKGINLPDTIMHQDIGIVHGFKQNILDGP